MGGICKNVQCPRTKCIEMAVWLYPNVIKDFIKFIFFLNESLIRNAAVMWEMVTGERRRLFGG